MEVTNGEELSAEGETVGMNFEKKIELANGSIGF